MCYVVFFLLLLISVFFMRVCVTFSFSIFTADKIAYPQNITHTHMLTQLTIYIYFFSFRLLSLPSYERQWVFFLATLLHAFFYFIVVIVVAFKHIFFSNLVGVMINLWHFFLRSSRNSFFFSISLVLSIIILNVMLNVNRSKKKLCEN